MTLNALSRSLFAAGFLLTATWACKTDDTPTPPVTPTYDVALKSTSLGNVLTDSKGMTLYFFSKDAAGTSTCTGGCLAAWPVFTAENLKLDPTLTATDFASVATPDGKKQITYQGWPLYYFAQDAVPGDVKGENVGKVWFVAKTSYSMMIASSQLLGNDGKSYILEAGEYKEGIGSTIYFTDAAGNTVYAFGKDKNAKNNYTKEDFSNDATWPIYYTELKDLPSTMDKTQFASIKVFGKDQLTYKGWPLYYFGPDNKTRGMNKGISVPKPGVWPIVQIDSPVAPAQ